MDYTYLFNNTEKKSKVGIIGARGYGYTLLAQIPKVSRMALRAICSIHPDECFEVLTEIGYPRDQMVLCETPEAIAEAPADAILVVSDYRLMADCGITALVECTGNTAVSFDAALTAMKKGVNVYMVSKETDSICGPLLARTAAEQGVVYALVNGDQPRNLIDLYSWAMLLGLDVVAAGKSSEYDFVWDRENGELTYTDGSGVREQMPQMLDCWRYQGVETLAQRQHLLERYTGAISADLCEMNLVSNITGLVPAADSLNYPIAKVSELADIFIPEADGGILKQTGVVDVFYNLRESDEASFCGGEFIIIKCHNEKVWEVLESKGHIVSRNGKYACIYYPYHLMGLESPVTILLGDLLGVGSHPECRQVAVMTGVAEVDLPKGTELKVAGHHHAIDGVSPRLMEQKTAENLAPFYLLNGVTLLRDVKAGDAVTLEDVDLKAVEMYQFYLAGL